MERNAAIRKLKKLLGPNAYWEVREGLTSPERRADYRDRAKAARAAHDAAVAAVHARRDAILAADTEYQQLLQASKATLKALDAVRYYDADAGYKFEVGTRGSGLGGLFTIKTPRAKGDTWEQVFAQLEATTTNAGGSQTEHKASRCDESPACAQRGCADCRRAYGPRS
jgi:hypothetical protein